MVSRNFHHGDQSLRPSGFFKPMMSTSGGQVRTSPGTLTAQYNHVLEQEMAKGWVQLIGSTSTYRHLLIYFLKSFITASDDPGIGDAIRFPWLLPGSRSGSDSLNLRYRPPQNTRCHGYTIGSRTCALMINEKSKERADDLIPFFLLFFGRPPLLLPLINNRIKTFSKRRMRLILSSVCAAGSADQIQRRPGLR